MQLKEKLDIAFFRKNKYPFQKTILFHNSGTFRTVSCDCTFVELSHEYKQVQSFKKTPKCRRRFI